MLHSLPLDLKGDLLVSTKPGSDWIGSQTEL